MTLHDDGAYWEQACRFFRATGLVDEPVAYFFHNRNARQVTIGTRPRVVVNVSGHLVTRVADGRLNVVALEPDDQVFTRVGSLLDDDAPCFLVASPDIRRRFVDSTIPELLVVQPEVEFVFSPRRPDGDVGYARDDATRDRARAALRSVPVSPRVSRRTDAGTPKSFDELVQGWTSDEDDAAFLGRLASAIEVLQQHPEGKMALTRSYRRARPARLDPFDLYEAHARTNGDYACSHLVRMGPRLWSVGVTPENVFEVAGRRLTVDVVAATCKATEDAAVLASELYANPKQVKEHTSSLANRQNRFRPYCEDGSIRVVQDMRVKALRNVSHLHSVFEGRLRSGVTAFDLMGGMFPLLGARPKELLPLADSERAPHRYYGGVVGHLHDGVGGCFLNIRSALLHDDVIHAKVGVGVLAESDASSELVETKDKLSGLLEAVHRWEHDLPP